jgi:hypothetical protein
VLAEIFIAVALLAATGYYWWFVIGKLVLTALRTGRLLGRGVVYDRQMQPKRFWFLLGAWVAMGVLFAFCTFIFIVGFANKHMG